MRGTMLLCLLALAACQPQAQAPIAGAAAPPQAAAEPAPPPEPQPILFEPISSNARALTGRITLSPLPRESANIPPQMKLESATGLIYTTELHTGGAGEAAALDWTSIFGAEVVTTPNAAPGAPSVELHIVGGETIPENTSGGYCGDDPALAIAMATGLVIDGKNQLAIAAFKGTRWPPDNASALCGVFRYSPPPRQPPPN